MKVKDWIKILKRADPEADLWVWSHHWPGEGFQKRRPTIRTVDMRKYTIYKQSFYHKDIGQRGELLKGQKALFLEVE